VLASYWDFGCRRGGVDGIVVAASEPADDGVEPVEAGSVVVVGVVVAVVGGGVGGSVVGGVVVVGGVGCRRAGGVVVVVGAVVLVVVVVATGGGWWRTCWGGEVVVTTDTVVRLVRCRPPACLCPDVVAVRWPPDDGSRCRSAVSMAWPEEPLGVAAAAEVKEAKTGTPAPVVRLGISGRVAPTYAGETEAMRSNLTSTPV
jgi:hypothetical protein